MAGAPSALNVVVQIKRGNFFVPSSRAAATGDDTSEVIANLIYGVLKRAAVCATLICSNCNNVNSMIL